MLPMYKKKLEEMNRPLRLNPLSDGLVVLVEHLIGMYVVFGFSSDGTIFVMWKLTLSYILDVIAFVKSISKIETYTRDGEEKSKKEKNEGDGEKSKATSWKWFNKGEDKEKKKSFGFKALQYSNDDLTLKTQVKMMRRLYHSLSNSWST